MPRDDSDDVRRRQATRPRELFRELPAAYRRAVPDAHDDAPGLALLRGYLRSPSDAARNALAEHFLPYVTAVVFHAHRRRRTARGFDPAPLDDMLCHAGIGLLDGIPGYAARVGVDHLHPFRAYIVRSALRAAFKAGRSARPGGFGGREREYAATRFRRRFVRAHGRSATADEVKAHLAGLVDNRGIAVEVGPAAALACLDLADDGPAADRPLIDAEARRLAERGLDAGQRAILRHALAGGTAEELARLLGVEPRRAAARMNAVLWQVRTRAELADYLGVERQARPATGRAKRLPAVASAPPARLVG